MADCPSEATPVDASTLHKWRHTRVMRVDEDGLERPSTVRATCSRCRCDGWRGDWPGQGGLVPDDGGALLCDPCAEDDDPPRRYVWAVDPLDLQGGEPLSEAEVDLWISRADDHAGDTITVRRCRSSEVAGLYLIRASGELQVLGCTYEIPEDLQHRTDEAWEHAWLSSPDTAPALAEVPGECPMCRRILVDGECPRGHTGGRDDLGEMY